VRGSGAAEMSGAGGRPAHRDERNWVMRWRKAKGSTGKQKKTDRRQGHQGSEMKSASGPFGGSSPTDAKMWTVFRIRNGGTRTEKTEVFIHSKNHFRELYEISDFLNLFLRNRRRHMCGRMTISLRQRSSCRIRILRRVTLSRNRRKIRIQLMKMPILGDGRSNIGNRW
jgi:hypothetical protein